MSENKITKNELVEAVFAETNLENKNVNFEKKDIQKVIESFLDQLKLSLENGNVIELRGFGTFEPRLRKGREAARNPKTGEKVSVQPHYVAAFRAGQELKKNLWNLPVEK